MNILSVSSLLFFAIIVNASVVSESDLKNLANNLLKRISASLASVSAAKNITNRLSQKVIEMKDSIDFGIPNNPQIIHVQNVLEKHNDSSIYVACANLKKHNEQNLKQELEDFLSYEVNIHLKDINSIIDNIQENLSGIAVHLQGSKLEEELKLCNNDEKQCKLTNDYKVEVDKVEKSIQNVINAASSLIDDVLKTEIYPKIPEKINTQIYEPIIRCLNHVD